MTDKSIKIHQMRRVYVWELPVRIYHWLNAGCILVLIATGFFIGDPLAIMSSKEATNQFLMGWVRFLHFAAAYIFLFNFLFRLYWGFVGNKYSQWHQFIPRDKKFFEEIWQILKIDILQLRGKEHVGIGHNALAGFIYFLTFIAFLIQIITGFGLYANTSHWWLPQMFSWVKPLFGGDIELRSIHHWAMWFFILFSVVHVYLVFYHDYVEGRGEISSMGGGWKFIEEDVFKEHKEERQREKSLFLSKVVKGLKALSRPSQNKK